MSSPYPFPHHTLWKPILRTCVREHPIRFMVCNLQRHPFRRIHVHGDTNGRSKICHAIIHEHPFVSYTLPNFLLGARFVNVRLYVPCMHILHPIKNYANLYDFVHRYVNVCLWIYIHKHLRTHFHMFTTSIVLTHRGWMAQFTNERL